MVGEWRFPLEAYSKNMLSCDRCFRLGRQKALYALRYGFLCYGRLRNGFLA